MDNKYVAITEQQFKDNSTLIIKSPTGSGKTTATAIAISRFNKNTNKPKKMLSIVSKTSLSDHHIKTLSDHHIKLVSYLDENKNIKLLFVVLILL